jgi:uncharacterized membrane protein (DUF2068 family)
MVKPRAPIVSIKRGEEKRHSRWPLILIGIGKLLKAVALIVVSFYILKLIRPEVHEHWEAVLDDWRDDPHNHILFGALQKLLSVTATQLKLLRVGTLVYAGLYGTEGIGLLFDKPWAEWMTVITTAGFIPWELYELFEHATTGKAGLLIFNILALVYLCFRLRWRGQVKRAAKHEAAGAAAQPSAASGVAV